MVRRDVNKREVFLVITVTPMGESEWLVRGRAYGDVRTGDVVYLDAATAKNEDDWLTFRVEGIRTYGREVPELNLIMTGDLVLQGQRGDLIREDSMLYVM
jgi:hypothetical protein